MTNIPYICCADCIWRGKCPEQNAVGDLDQFTLTGVICDDYSPADERDRTNDYEQDLKERAAAYDPLLREFQ